MTEGGTGTVAAAGPATDEVTRLTHEAGARDVLVFRRISAHAHAHLGGAGRGKGWAGIVEVDDASDPVFEEAVRTGVITRHDGGSARIVGPYYAATAAIVPVNADVAVVWGCPSGSPTLAARTDDWLCAASAVAAAEVSVVSPAKRLADELEVLQAVQSLTRCFTNNLDEAMNHIVAVAAESLSCELAVLRMRSGRAVVVAPAGTVAADRAALESAVAVLADRLEGPVCVQDAADQPLPVPLSPADGVVAYYAVPLAEPVGGVLLLAHLTATPRGFTQLCRQLGQQLAEAATGVLHVATMRTNMQELLEVTSGQARRDPLTGMGNRFVWMEALAAAQQRAGAGAAYSLISVDIDGLKEVNDACGHGAGDGLIAAAGTVFATCLRADREIVCRLGGDEFGVLLPGADEPAAARVVTRLRAALDSATSADGLPLSASIGAATTRAGTTVEETFGEADSAMYAEKLARRLAVHPGDPAGRRLPAPRAGGEASRRPDPAARSGPVG